MIDISQFQGEIPRISDKLLPDTNATSAINCDLDSGNLKPIGEEETIVKGPVIYKDGSLKGTSAWANTFLERDHFARQAEHARQTGDTGVD